MLLAESGVLPPRPQVGLGNLLQRHSPTRFQSPPGSVTLVRSGTENWRSLVTSRLVENLERWVVSGSPSWKVPAAATPPPTPMSGLEVTKGARVTWNRSLAASAGAAGRHHPVASPSQSGKSRRGGA